MNIAIDLADPLVQTFAIPFIVGLVAVGIIRFMGGVVKGAMLASLGVGIGTLACFAMLKGMPQWPVSSAVHLLGWALIGGLALGLLLDLWDPAEGLVKIFSLLVPITLVFWLGFLLKGNQLDVKLAISYGALMGFGYMAFDRLNHDRDNGIASPVSGAMAALGLGLIGQMAGHSFFVFGFALALSSLAFMVWNWPKSRFPWGLGGTLLLAGPVLVIAATMVLSRGGMGLAVGLVLLTFLSKPLADWLVPSRGMAAPFIQIFIGALPLLAAVATMHFKVQPF